MENEQFILVLDTQRKAYYLTLASALKNTEGLKIVEKFPNEIRAMDALKKYSSGEKVFGTLTPKLNLKDALGEALDIHEVIDSKTEKVIGSFSSYTLAKQKEKQLNQKEPNRYYTRPVIPQKEAVGDLAFNDPNDGTYGKPQQ